jgi:iron-sulfur cluster assembly protein
MNNVITVTENAKNQVLKILQSESLDNTYFVRVAVKSGGCSGLKYDLDFDNVLKTDDVISESNDIKVVCDKKSVLYLIGTELDYSGGLNGKGFIFNNPQASRSCGCGESFSL